MKAYTMDEYNELKKELAAVDTEIAKVANRLKKCTARLRELGLKKSHIKKRFNSAEKYIESQRNAAELEALFKRFLNSGITAEEVRLRFYGEEAYVEEENVEE